MVFSSGGHASCAAASITGTCTSGSIITANAAPERRPKTPAATAITISKLLGSERARGLGIIQADDSAQKKADEEHRHEVNQKRNGTAYHIHGQFHDQVTLDRERRYKGKSFDAEDTYFRINPFSNATAIAAARESTPNLP
jgi:hypothetical protein